MSRFTRPVSFLSLFVLGGILVFSGGPLAAADQPQWGRAGSRNMVSGETGLPDTFDPGTRNAQTGEIDLPDDSGVKWVARLGGQSYGSPVIAGGRVFVGTNNDAPRDPRVEGDRGVLMCFDEKSGEFLWQLSVPKNVAVKWCDWQYIGLTSPPSVDGSRAYLVSNRNEVMCLDVEGMANGNDGPYTDEGRHMVAEGEKPLEPGPKDADIVWIYDVIAQTKAEMHNGANCSVLIHGDLLYVCTANGVEWTHSRVLHPEAPSVIVLDKHTGKLVARDQFGIGPDITHGQWSSVAMGKVGKRTLGFFGAGNGYAYAFDMLDRAKLGQLPSPASGRGVGGEGGLAQQQLPSPAGGRGVGGEGSLAQQQLPSPAGGRGVGGEGGPRQDTESPSNDPKEEPLPLKNVWKFNGHPLAQTQDRVEPDHQHDSTSYQVTAMPVFYNSRLYVPLTQEAFHGMKLGWLVCLDAAKHGDITRKGLVWKYDAIKSTVSTPAIADGLVYAADFAGVLHCLDADTGRCYWTHDVGGPIWGSPLAADGKVYLGTGRNTLWVFKAGKQKKIINSIRTRDGIFSTPVAANGVLYVMTNKHLYAVGK